MHFESINGTFKLVRVLGRKNVTFNNHTSLDTQVPNKHVLTQEKNVFEKSEILGSEPSVWQYQPEVHCALAPQSLGDVDGRGYWFVHIMISWA